MALALWCDLKDYGHAFDERKAILVKWKEGSLYFCQDHCVPAFSVAFQAARKSDRSEITLPTFGKPFTILVKDAEVDFDFLDKITFLEMIDAFFAGERWAGQADKGQKQASGSTDGKDTGDAGQPAGIRVEKLLSMLKDGPEDAEGPDGRLKGIRVLCCGATDRGHAFDEREAITVTLKSRKQDFCKGHCITAFNTAFRAACEVGESKIRAVKLGGSFIIRRNDGDPQRTATKHDGNVRERRPGPGSRA